MPGKKCSECCFLHHGHDDTHLQVDMSDEEQVENLVLKAVEWGGKLDIWVNNAAKFVFGAATTASNAGV